MTALAATAEETSNPNRIPQKGKKPDPISLECSSARITAFLLQVGPFVFQGLFEKRQVEAGFSGA